MSDNHSTPTDAPRWMRWTLYLAAGYNLFWGGWVVLFPNSGFDAMGMDRPLYPAIWQCVGMIVGVYGIGYAIAATHPARHWPIVLVGLLGKVFGPIGFVWQAVILDNLPLSFGYFLIFNDLVWWVPFVLILRHAYRAASQQSAPSDQPTASL
ncbi:MAG: alkyl hydroperoxide reductase [Planctomycetota bacterium]